MAEVRILCGGYGLNDGHGVRLVKRGETASVDEKEAERLIALGAAERTDRPQGMPEAEDTAEKAGEPEARPEPKKRAKKAEG